MIFHKLMKNDNCLLITNYLCFLLQHMHPCTRPTSYTLIRATLFTVITDTLHRAITSHQKCDWSKALLPLPCCTVYVPVSYTHTHTVLSSRCCLSHPKLSLLITSSSSLNPAANVLLRDTLNKQSSPVLITFINFHNGPLNMQLPQRSSLTPSYSHDFFDLVFSCPFWWFPL